MNDMDRILAEAEVSAAKAELATEWQTTKKAIKSLLRAIANLFSR